MIACVVRHCRSEYLSDFATTALHSRGTAGTLPMLHSPQSRTAEHAASRGLGVDAASVPP
jgi:hypothetical protein